MMVEVVARVHLDGLCPVVRRWQDAPANMSNLENDFFLLMFDFC